MILFIWENKFTPPLPEAIFKNYPLELFLVPVWIRKQSSFLPHALLYISVNPPSQHWFSNHAKILLFEKVGIYSYTYFRNINPTLLELPICLTHFPSTWQLRYLPSVLHEGYPLSSLQALCFHRSILYTESTVIWKCSNNTLPVYDYGVNFFEESQYFHTIIINVFIKSLCKYWLKSGSC